MHIGRYLCGSLLLLSGLTCGCAGNGEGLDQNGQPITTGGGTGSGPITADFQSIQENVFTPICSQCHIGASAPEGLQLDAAHSYNLLVGVPSVEQPGLLRVNPGDPEASYIVHKIEGQAGITGGQMPLGETPLPQATIDAIRQWITNGAPNTPASAAVAAQGFAVQATAPMDRAAVRAPLERIVVTFTRDVDATLVNGNTVTIEKIDASTGARNSLAAGSALAPANPAVLLITPTAGLVPGMYRVTVRGTGAAALADMNAAPLGADTSFEFIVQAAE